MSVEKFSSADAIVGAEVNNLRETLAACLVGQGWANLLGKERGGEQTLLEHSLAVFDTLVACLPLLASDVFPQLSPNEAQALLLAAITHDAGKADPAFQAYLRGERASFAEHVDPESIRKVATGLIDAARLDVGASLDDIVSSAVLHDRRMRRGPGELRELARDHASPRWRKLADAVDKADSAASAADVSAAVRFLRLPDTRILTGGNSVGFYQLRLLGVATTLLHEAATRAFESRGWMPVLFHAEGTVLLGTGDSAPSVEDGLTSRRIRSMARKTLVIGTAALEVGVDFRTSRLVFEALSSASFIQRLGRVGRHQPGEAHFITDGRVAQALASVPAETGRNELFARIRDLLTADDDLASFPRSRWAGVVAFAALAALAGEISRLGGSAEFENRLLDVERAMAAILGTTPEEAQRAVDNPKVWKRLAAAVGFRGGAGSVEVFDVCERDRRGSPELARYEIDLRTFYARAQLATGTEQRTKPIVVGYVKKRSLHLDLSLKTAQVTPSLNAPEAARIELRVDGQVPPYEDLLRDELPVVGFFPRQLRGRLSWREDVFESSDGRIALLNDDALKAMYLLEC